MEGLLSWISQYSYVGIFALLMFGIVGLPIPDETLLAFCGYLIWRNQLQLLPTFLAGWGGSLCGITLSYWIGRTGGHRFVTRYGRYIGATEQRLSRVDAWFARFGSWLLAAGYFVPGVRHFTALVAGITAMKWRTFAVFAYAGAAIWVAAFLSLGYAVGDRWQQTSESFHRYFLIGGAVVVITGSIAWLARGRVKRRRLKGGSA